MTPPKYLQQLAKILTYILERRPDEFGLIPDSNGFVKIKELLKAFSEEEGWKHVRRSHLNEIRLTLPDPPFEIADNFIRGKRRDRLPRTALASEPPKLLYTCVRRKAYPHVVAKGIFPSGYPQVVLSSNREMTLRMGRRIDQDPVLLTVHARKSVDRGVIYYHAGETLYLAASIPPGCFTGPALPKEKPEPKKPDVSVPSAPQKLAGSFILDWSDATAPERNSRNHRQRQAADWKRDRKKIKKPKRPKEPPPWRR